MRMWQTYGGTSTTNSNKLAKFVRVASAQGVLSRFGTGASTHQVNKHSGLGSRVLRDTPSNIEISLNFKILATWNVSGEDNRK